MEGVPAATELAGASGDLRALSHVCEVPFLEDLPVVQFVSAGILVYVSVRMLLVFRRNARLRMEHSREFVSSSSTMAVGTAHVGMPPISLSSHVC